jgi:nicotinamidase-related amidase
MAITEIDARTALIVIDLQEGFRSFPGTVPPSVIFDRAAELARAFRRSGLPVVLVTVEPKEGATPPRTERTRALGVRPENFAEVVPELDPQPGDLRIVKHGANAFHQTGLDTKLRAAGVTQVVVVGITTSVGVESTVRAAYELGYNVTTPVDVMSDREAELHTYSVARVFPRMGEVGAAADVLARLGPREAAL